MKKSVSHSPWAKEVRKALVDRDMTISSLAKAVGYSTTVVSGMLNGRYSRNCKSIAEKINNELGTKGMPDFAGNTPSDEWCKNVRKGLIDKGMTIIEMANQIGYSRDQVSLVINGHCYNQKMVTAINNLLGIKQTD